MYVIPITSNMFTGWRVNFSCFFLCWCLNSLELFNNGPQWFFCYFIGHSCTTPSIKIAEVIISFFFFCDYYKKLRAAKCQGKTRTEVISTVVSLYSSVWVHILFLVLNLTFRLLEQQLVTSVSTTTQTDVDNAARYWEKKYFNSMVYSLFDSKSCCLDSF